MPPVNKMSGPPPGSTPQGLSAIARQDQPNPSGGGGGLKDVFDELQFVLDSLASIIPAQAEEIDEIKTRLSEILAQAISGGAAFEGKSGLKSPNSGFPY